MRSNQVPNPETATMPTQLLPRPMHGRTGGLCQETGIRQIKRAINLTAARLLTWSYDYGHLVKHVHAGQMPRVSCGAQDPLQRDPGLPNQLHTPEVPRAPFRDHWRATRPECRCYHVEVSIQYSDLRDIDPNCLCFRCAVCSEKAYVNPCAHCDKKVCSCSI